jgi:hypothetical protein
VINHRIIGRVLLIGVIAGLVGCEIERQFAPVGPAAKIVNDGAAACGGFTDPETCARIRRAIDQLQHWEGGGLMDQKCRDIGNQASALFNAPASYGGFYSRSTFAQDFPAAPPWPAGATGVTPTRPLAAGEVTTPTGRTSSNHRIYVDPDEAVSVTGLVAHEFGHYDGAVDGAHSQTNGLPENLVPGLYCRSGF